MVQKRLALSREMSVYLLIRTAKLFNTIQIDHWDLMYLNEKEKVWNY